MFSCFINFSEMLASYTFLKNLFPAVCQSLELMLSGSHRAVRSCSPLYFSFPQPSSMVCTALPGALRRGTTRKGWAPTRTSSAPATSARRLPSCRSSRSSSVRPVSWASEASSPARCHHPSPKTAMLRLDQPSLACVCGSHSGALMWFLQVHSP